MNPIGGYFSLELPMGDEYHHNALRLNTGRNCLEYILRARSYRKVYIPYYTCDVVLEPFQKVNVEYEFYPIDLNFELAQPITLHCDEALLYINYYGLKQRYVDQLAEQYGHQLIVDNTQAFYAKPIQGVDTFYTCRKFFGVPDGAYLYTDRQLNVEIEQDVSWDRMSFLTKRIDLGAEAGFMDFREQSKRLVGQPIRRMSNLTQRLMQSIDYDTSSLLRRNNFIYLHDALGDSNQLHLHLSDDSVPMVYPYLTADKSLKNRLIADKIFVATYWPNVFRWCQLEDWEYYLTERTIFIPVDQRYRPIDLQHIIKTITKFS